MEFVDLKSQYRALKREIDARIQRVLDHRSEEHTSELQSQSNIVCRLLLEKKKPNHIQLKLSTHHVAHSAPARPPPSTSYPAVAISARSIQEEISRLEYTTSEDDLSGEYHC